MVVENGDEWRPSHGAEEDRLSITIFLGIPQLHGAIGEHVHTRGEQEHRVAETQHALKMLV